MADIPSSSDAAPAAELSNPRPSSAPSSETEKKPREQPAAAQPTPAAAVVFKPPAQMQRPGLGKSGKRIDLLCNHFSVKYTGAEDVFHYDVSISDAGSASGPNDGIANKNLCRTILAKVHQVYGMKEFGGKRFAYDGEKSLFTPGPLQFQTQEFSVLLEESTNAKAGPSASQEDPKKKRKVAARSREFKVKVEYAATVKMGAINDLLSGKRNDRAQDALRVLDIVMRQHAAAKGYLLIKDNYFSPTFGVADIGEGVQTCQGFHVSFRPSLQGLSLNLDTATTTVIKPSSVLEFIRERFNPSNPRSIDWDKVRRVLKGIKVETPHTQMVHRIIGFSDSSCAEQKFMKKKLDDTGNMVEIELTIQKYYEMQYNITIRYPDLPCIAAGRPKRPTYIPVELCNIVEGQRYTKALSSSQRQKMIDQARQGPDQRKNVVQKAMEVSDYNSNDLVRDFNIKIDTKMRVVPGRLLDAPALKFGNTEEVPRSGRWNFNSKVMASAVQIKSWVVLNFDGRIPTQAVDRIAQDLARVCSTKGMNIPAHDFTLQEPRHNQQLPAAQRVHNMIQEVKQRLQSPPAFMLCILPVRKTSDLYGPLKTLLQTKHAIITQCIAPPRQVKDQYLTNVALKINAKVGGYNSFLSLEFQGKLPKVSRVPTVIFGLDVSHGPAGYSDSPSIAAVVASREWPHVSKYGVRLSAQSRKVEMISGLFEDSKSGGMIVELLKDFHNSCQQVPGITDRRPKQVIIFRDGVSESQFEQVLRDEFLAFKKAFDYIDKSGNYDPKITLIVVQKRHHTRFFPANGSGNVAPGTIVDANLCHPRDYDFYLCAHAGLIGTTRPTHYHVLVDENNFTVDELQLLTHSLCYTYARSTTAVSTVTPVAYAHLAATHARNFLDSEGGSETSSMTGRSERSTHVHLPDLHAQMKTKMFFC